MKEKYIVAKSLACIVGTIIAICILAYFDLRITKWLMTLV